MKKVVLFGNSPSTIMVYYQLTADPNYTVCGFTVDEDYLNQKTLFNLPIVAFEKVDTVFPTKDYQMLIAIAYVGMNKVRAQKYFETKEKGYSFITYVHPSSLVYPNVSIGENCLVGPFTVIQPSTQIGNNVIIRENCHIGHDNHIQDHCFIAGNSNISGNVIVEPYCFLGAGSIIINWITLKKSSLVGAGVTMLENSNENEVYMRRSAQKLPFPSDRLKI